MLVVELVELEVLEELDVLEVELVVVVREVLVVELVELEVLEELDVLEDELVVVVREVLEVELVVELVVGGAVVTVTWADELAESPPVSVTVTVTLNVPALR